MWIEQDSISGEFFARFHARKRQQKVPLKLQQGFRRLIEVEMFV
jgi:hypothetical protein